MSVFASKSGKSFEIPNSDGATVVLRKLTPAQLGDAIAAEKVSDAARNLALFKASVESWSLDRDLNDDALMDLDTETAAWLVNQINRHTMPSMFEKADAEGEQKNG